MTIEHFDALSQGITRWQLTLCLTIICAAYLCVTYLDQKEEHRAECVKHSQFYSDSLDKCLTKEPRNAAP